jgi:hypothetical protein
MSQFVHFGDQEHTLHSVIGTYPFRFKNKTACSFFSTVSLISSSKIWEKHTLNLAIFTAISHVHNLYFRLHDFLVPFHQRGVPVFAIHGVLVGLYAWSCTSQQKL